MQNHTVSAMSSYHTLSGINSNKLRILPFLSDMSPFSDIYGTLPCYPHLAQSILVSFFDAGSFSLSHKLAKITAREAPFAKPSFCIYYKPLNLKCTLLTAKFSSFFIVLRDVSGAFTCSYNLLRAISTASLSGTLVYKLFTSWEIILSSESNSVFSKISLVI